MSFGGASETREINQTIDQTSTGLSTPILEGSIVDARNTLLGALSEFITTEAADDPLLAQIQERAGQTISDYLAGTSTVSAAQQERLSAIAEETIRSGGLEIDESVLQGMREVTRETADRNLGEGGSVGAYLRGEIARAATIARGKLASGALIAKQQGLMGLETENLNAALQGLSTASTLRNQSTASRLQAAAILGSTIAAAPYATRTESEMHQTTQGTERIQQTPSVMGSIGNMLGALSLAAMAGGSLFAGGGAAAAAPKAVTPGASGVMMGLT